MLCVGRFFLFFVGMEESENLALDFRAPNIYQISVIISTLIKIVNQISHPFEMKTEFYIITPKSCQFFSPGNLNGQKIKKKKKEKKISTFLGLSKWRRI